jgi:hypothetical protein
VITALIIVLGFALFVLGGLAIFAMLHHPKLRAGVEVKRGLPAAQRLRSDVWTLLQGKGEKALHKAG